MPLAGVHGFAGTAQAALYTPAHSLIDQSLHSRLGAETTNGDGFGVGWYGDAPDAGRVPQHRAGLERPEPARARRAHPLVAFFAHIRAAIGSAVQQTNCHPFRHGRWLFMHNGYIDGFATIKRDLVLAIDPSLYPADPGPDRLRGVVLPGAHLRPEDDPPARSRRRSGWWRRRPRARRAHPFQGTIATTDGESIWAFRYSSEGKSRSLFFTTDVPTLRTAVPGAGAARRSLRRRAADRLRAARRPARRLERGARGQLRHRRTRPRRDAHVHADAAEEVGDRQHLRRRPAPIRSRSRRWCGCCSPRCSRGCPGPRRR